jgi:hypothetical protein
MLGQLEYVQNAPRAKSMQEQENAPSGVQVRDLPQVRSVAYLLIVVGILELIFGLWTAPPGQIKLNFLLLAVGLALYFGSTRVIAVIRWLALLTVVPAVLMPLQQTLLAPLELTMVQLRLYPSQVVAFFVPLILSAVVAVVLAWRLNSEPVKAALRTHGRVPAGPIVPVVLGLLLIIGSTAFLRQALNGPDAAQATNMVAKRFGTKYKYFTNQVNVVNNKGTTVYATVQMWNEKEAIQVPVNWRR